MREGRMTMLGTKWEGLMTAWCSAHLSEERREKREWELVVSADAALMITIRYDMRDDDVFVCLFELIKCCVKAVLRSLKLCRDDRMNSNVSKLFQSLLATVMCEVWAVVVDWDEIRCALLLVIVELFAVVAHPYDLWIAIFHFLLRAFLSSSVTEGRNVSW